MDKVKIGLIAIIAVLVIVSIILTGNVANLNMQLGAEKAKTSQLNNQIAGSNTTVNDLQAQLASATARAAEQSNLANSLQASVSNLQNSLSAANAELEKIKTAYADIESKLKEQIPVISAPQPAAVKQIVPVK